MRNILLAVFCSTIIINIMYADKESAGTQTTSPKLQKRIRDYGLQPGSLPSGKYNLITDVPGVTVGHLTRKEGDRIRTGVTVVDPGVDNLYHKKIPAAIAVGNGFGKLAGVTQVNELGTLETPIALTNTLAVGPAMQGVVELVLRNTKNKSAKATINAVVGETNDGLVNDIHQIVIKPSDVSTAYDNRGTTFALGSEGAGTGTCCFGWKGGIGSASRVVTIGEKKYTLGALLQTNFGGQLTIMGAPVWKELRKADAQTSSGIPGDGSCMIVLATDAPVSARQLGRIARRAMLGLGRTGSYLAHGSGDYVIAFSTNRAGVEGSDAGNCLADEQLNSLFLSAVETVEESVYDSLFCSETVSGRDGNTLQQIPIDEVLGILKRHGL